MEFAGQTLTILFYESDDLRLPFRYHLKLELPRLNPGFHNELMDTIQQRLDDAGIPHTPVIKAIDIFVSFSKKEDAMRAKLCLS
jgi:hypothetical protein